MDFIRSLPKVELHLHLVGAASPQTVADLAARRPDAGVPTDLNALKDLYRFRDFGHFIEVYKTVAATVRGGEDVRTLVTGLARDLAAQNVRYAEVMVAPYLHHTLGMADDELLGGLAEGRKLAAARHRVELAWIFDIPGEYGLPAAHHTLALAARRQPDGLVGLSLAGVEHGVRRADFAGVFAEAVALGLHSVPHAGETVGPAEVWSAVRELRAERIGHAVGAVRDPRLLEHLAAHGIAVEACPTSNLRTGAVPSLEQHPVRQMLDAGVLVTVNTDDPPMFGATLCQEYAHVARLAALDHPGIARLAANAVSASFLDGATKAHLLHDLTQAARTAHRRDLGALGPEDGA